MLDDLYQELLLDHAKHPHNTGELGTDALSIQLLNPLCGDEIKLFLQFGTNQAGSGNIAEVKFQGNGCSVSHAAASMMTDLLKGLSLEQVKDLSGCYRRLIGGLALEKDKGPLGDLVALEGVKNYPVRSRCALLIAEAMDALVRRYEKHCEENCKIERCPEDCLSTEGSGK